MRLDHKLIVFIALLNVSLPAAQAQEVSGERLADACSSCHGLAGQGGTAIPPIAGKPVDAFVAQMQAFRDQTAEATIMNRLARGYTDAEFAALADYFSTLEAK